MNKKIKLIMLLGVLYCLTSCKSEKNISKYKVDSCPTWVQNN